MTELQPALLLTLCHAVMYKATCEVLTALLLRIHIFWDVNASRGIEGLSCLHVLRSSSPSPRTIAVPEVTIQHNPTSHVSTTAAFFCFRHNAANNNNMRTANWQRRHHIRHFLLKKEVSSLCSTHFTHLHKMPCYHLARW